MSFDHHLDDLTLKSPKITVNCDFEKSTLLLSISSKPERKDSNSILFWLVDLYVTATYPFLFCNADHNNFEARLCCVGKVVKS